MRPWAGDRRRHLRARLHEPILIGFLVVVLGHWAEHLVQAFQVYVLGWPAPSALGALGSAAPGLVSSEWLHWVYNAAVLAGIALLLPAFAGRARGWWIAALAAQAWHVFEHTFLLGQALTHHMFLGRPVPTSVAQLFVPRIELHLLYNGVVTAFLVAAYAVHRAGARRGVALTAPS